MGSDATPTGGGTQETVFIFDDGFLYFKIFLTRFSDFFPFIFCPFMNAAESTGNVFHHTSSIILLHIQFLVLSILLVYVIKTTEAKVDMLPKCQCQLPTRPAPALSLSLFPPPPQAELTGFVGDYMSGLK